MEAPPSVPMGQQAVRFGAAAHAAPAFGPTPRACADTNCVHVLTPLLPPWRTRAELFVPAASLAGLAPLECTAEAVAWVGGGITCLCPRSPEARATTRWSTVGRTDGEAATPVLWHGKRSATWQLARGSVQWPTL